MNVAILKKYVSNLMGTNPNTSNYSLFRTLYNDLEAEDGWAGFANELNNISESAFEKYIKSL